MDSVLSNEVARRIAADLATLVSEAEKHGTLPRIKSVAFYFNETELRTIIKFLRSCRGVLDPAQASPDKKRLMDLAEEIEDSYQSSPFIQDIVLNEEERRMIVGALHALAAQPPAAPVETPPCVHKTCDDPEWCAGEPKCRYAHPRSSAVIAADWVPSKETEGPNGSGYYTAGIDIPIKNDPFGPRLHYSAIEFHCKDKAEAERRRDAVLAALTDTGPQAAPISVAMDALVSVGNQDAFLDMPRYTRNLVNRAIEKLAGVAEQSGAGAPETSVRCGAPAATTPPQGASK